MRLTLSPWGPGGPFALLSSPCSPYASNIVTGKKQKKKQSMDYFSLNLIVRSKINVYFIEKSLTVETRFPFACGWQIIACTTTLNDPISHKMVVFVHLSNEK